MGFYEEFTKGVKNYSWKSAFCYLIFGLCCRWAFLCLVFILCISVTTSTTLGEGNALGYILASTKQTAWQFVF
jgi:hypothetical protein